MGKKCSKCGIVKPKIEFQKSCKAKDGLQSQCKECRKIYKAKIPETYEIVTEKVCRICGLLKPINSFFKDKRRKDLHRNECKECENKQLKIYFEDNKRIVTEKVCLKCGESKPISMFHKSSDRYDGHREVCKECICKYPIGHAEQLREEILKSGKKECTKCKQTKPLSQFYKRKDGKLGYTPLCKSCWSSKYADYYEKNYEKIIEIGQRRLAAERGLKSDFTKDDWFQCLNAFDYTCAYCGKHSKKLQQEHFIPVNKLGTYTKDNIIPACPRCNQSKSNKNFIEWYRAQKFYSLEGELFIMSYLNQFKGGEDIGLV